MSYELSTSLSDQGIATKAAIHANLGTAALVEHAIAKGETVRRESLNDAEALADCGVELLPDGKTLPQPDLYSNLSIDELLAGQPLQLSATVCGSALPGCGGSTAFQCAYDAFTTSTYCAAEVATMPMPSRERVTFTARVVASPPESIPDRNDSSETHLVSAAILPGAAAGRA